MTRRITYALLVLLAIFAPQNLRADEKNALDELLRNSKRVVFLGDSITASGVYIGYFDAWLTARRLPHKPTIIDAGLASETVSGLSEEGHAGGKFPRPDVAERLDRVLDLAKPDLVIACYGINCGIYQPLNEERFKRYQEGMTKLKAEVEKRGSKFIVMTPPMFDDARAKNKFSYNEVLDRYAEWLLSRRADGWNVVDLHVPMTKEVLRRREKDPTFTMQPDAVHPNDQGHWFMAQTLIRAFGDATAADHASPREMLVAMKAPDALLSLVQQRVNVLRDSYVGTAGHKRPGVAKGLPVSEAEAKAAELTAKIDALWVKN